MKKILQIIIFLYLSVRVFCHPHVFVDNFLDIKFNNIGIKGIEFKWIYKKMYSQTVKEAIKSESNLKGEFSEKKEAIKKSEFDSFKKYNYNIHMKINNKDYKIQKI